MPHPLENKIEIKVQTNNEKRPTEAFVKALDGILEDVRFTQNEFSKKLEAFKEKNKHSNQMHN
jgi:DNA-directed RNA polymerase subunit L